MTRAASAARHGLCTLTRRLRQYLTKTARRAQPWRKAAIVERVASAESDFPYKSGRRVAYVDRAVVYVGCSIDAHLG
jgi:hypothetical protein